MSTLTLNSVSQSSSDPTIQIYNITYQPPEFNGQTWNETTNPISFSFADMYNRQVAGLNNQTISQVLSNPAYHDTKINLVSPRFTGNHGYDCGAGTWVNLSMYGQNGTNQGSFDYTDNRSGSITTYFLISQSVRNPPPLDHYTVSFGRIDQICANYAFNNMQLSYTINLQVGMCNSKSIDNPQCVNYCITNPNICKNDYIDYCFSYTNNDPTTMPIGSNTPSGTVCRNFVQNNGPVVEFDNGLKTYCAAKYKGKGFGDLFNDPNNQPDIDLCACHMPEEQYQSFAQEIFKTYEGFGSIGLINQCLVPQCASGGFKSTITTKTCPLPACLNIVTFNNDGTFNNSDVTINQTSDCANIKPVGGGGGGGGGDWTWLWIALAIIAVIIVLIVIFALSVKYKHHKRESIIHTSVPILSEK